MEEMDDKIHRSHSVQKYIPKLNFELVKSSGYQSYSLLSTEFPLCVSTDGVSMLSCSGIIITQRENLLLKKTNLIYLTQTAEASY